MAKGQWEFACPSLAAADSLKPIHMMPRIVGVRCAAEIALLTDSLLYR